LVTYEGGAIDLKKVNRVAIDTTVQEKAIAHPTDQGLLAHAIFQKTFSQSYGIEVYS
jgi:hypothetical protein